jgi:hypothetical protein
MLAVARLRQTARLALAVCLAGAVGLGAPSALASAPRAAGAPSVDAANGSKERAASSHHTPRRVVAATPKRLLGDPPQAEVTSTVAPLPAPPAARAVAEPLAAVGVELTGDSARAPPAGQVLRS